jgi:hypothetical protein
VGLLLACGSLDERAPAVAEESASESLAGAEGASKLGDEPAPAPPASEVNGGSLPLDGMTVPGDDGPRLSVDETSFDFGGTRAAGEPRAFDWVVTNVGGQPTVEPLLLTASNEAAFVATNGCAAALAPGAACAIHVEFAPQTAGSYTGELRLTHGTEALTLAVAGKGQYLLTINVFGRGEVSSSPPGLSCDATSCVGLFDPVEITLTARTANGSGSVHGAWAIPGCRAAQTCRYTLDGDRTITTEFAAPSNNLIFTSSERFPVTLGSVEAYDAECNRLASAAGINDADGAAFIAAMSSSTISLRERLSGARGWVRTDTLPVFDSVDEMFDAGMRYYVAYDETGAQVPAVADAFGAATPGAVISGTAADGTAVETCNDWTAAESIPGEVPLRFRAGRPSGGPVTWTDAILLNCTPETRFPITCMGVRRSAPVIDPLPDGTLIEGAKQIWVSNTPYTPGAMTPDEKCQSERPVGVDRGVAFIAYRDRPAAAVLDPTANYFRPDGAFVGSGAILTSLDIFTAPWILADGSVLRDQSQYVWTGAGRPNQLAIVDNNCEDWTVPSGETRSSVGDYGRGGARFFLTIDLLCSGAYRLYCVEP